MQAAELHCGDHSLIRIGQSLYSFGKNTYGQLLRGASNGQAMRCNYDDDDGAESEESQISRATPSPVEGFDGKGIFCCGIGFDHSLALCADGLFVAGRFLGKTCSPPVRIPFFNGRAVRLVSSGHCSDHILVSCDDGVFAMGTNSHGQLGLGDTHDRHVPHELIDFHGRPITAIATGHQFTLVLCDGTLYSFGIGTMCGNGGQDQTIPTKVKYFKDRVVTQVACGRHSSLVVCGSSLYHFGRAIGCQHVLRTFPQKLDFFDSKVVKKMAVGIDHYMVLCNGEELYTFGRNSYGELGHGGRENTTEPKLVTALAGQTIDAIAAGPHLSLVLTANGQVFGFGDHFDGKLGVGVYDNWDGKSKYLEPTLLPVFNDILEAEGYKQMRLQPLSLVPGVLTQGTRPPMTEEEIQRLKQYEEKCQHEIEEGKTLAEQQETEKNAGGQLQYKIPAEQDAQQDLGYTLQEKERRPFNPMSAQLLSHRTEVLISDKLAAAGSSGKLPTTEVSLEQRVQKEVEERLRRMQPDKVNMEEQIRREIEARTKEGRSPLDSSMLMTSKELGHSREYRREDERPPSLDTKVRTEIEAMMQSRRPGDQLSLEERIRAEVSQQVKSVAATARSQTGGQGLAQQRVGSAEEGRTEYLTAAGGPQSFTALDQHQQQEQQSVLPSPPLSLKKKKKKVRKSSPGGDTLDEADPEDSPMHELQEMLE